MKNLLDQVTNQPIPTGGVMALGNFDGVHLGHRAVFAVAKDVAHKEKCRAYALTFDPHPQTYLHQGLTAYLLTLPEEKRRQVLGAGIDGVVTLSFAKELSAMTAEDFIDEILIKQCQVKHVVVGYDFVFGKGRSGTIALLHEKLEPHGINVIDVAAKKDKSGEVVSSSRIRKALEEGKIQEANDLLGRQFNFTGKVQHGEKRGRLLDFPTANIVLDKDLVHPKRGVYAVWVRRIGEDMWWPAVANFGVRPTFDHKKELFEFHILDFHGEFYGTDWEVCLAVFLRPEKKFSDSLLLKEQIKEDAAAARGLLKRIKKTDEQ